MQIKGIDVSRHQGKIDWGKTAAELKRVNNNENSGFVMIRAGYSKRDGTGGLVLDSRFLENVIGCHNNGIPFGLYVYSYDQSATAAHITAEDLLQTIEEFCIMPEYPIAYDIEYENFNKAADADINTAIVKAFVDVIENKRYYAAVYASRDFFKNHLIDSQLIGVDHWEAAHSNTPSTGSNRGMLQYSSGNPLMIDGFGVSLDCNIAYKDYPTIMKKYGLNGFSPEESARVDATKNESDRYTISIEDAPSDFSKLIVQLCKMFNIDYLIDLND